MNLGRAIKLCRNQRGLSQQELAARAGVSASYLSLLEQNKRDPTLSTIEKLALAVGVPVGVLVFIAAEKDDLAGIGPDLAEKLSFTALTFLRESNDKQSPLL